MAISSVLGSSALLPAGLGFRNELINGAFQVDQRNNSASQTITAAAALAYTTDRWYAYCTGANVTGQRIAGSAPFQYNYRFTGATSNTLVGFGQRIEAANSFNCAGATATLSAYIKSSSLTSITWSLYYATTTDSFGTVASPTRTLIATGTFTISSTLTRYSTQISVPAAATTGLELVFTTGALVASQTLEFTGVQLEQNYQPTPFEQRPIGVELGLCQRYFERIQPLVAYQMLASGFVTATTNGAFCLFYETKRAAPTSIAFTAASTFAINNSPDVATTVTSIAINASRLGTKSANVHAAVASGLTVGQGCHLNANSSASSTSIDVSAEL
jgi:hypothetical protein